MNEVLRDRILRKLESLSDERVYQVLDYIEFMESKYASRQAPAASIFQRFAEGVEDTMRAGRVSTAAINETMNLMNRAMSVLQGAVAAGKSVANDMVSASRTPPPSSSQPGTPPPSSAPPSSASSSGVPSSSTPPGGTTPSTSSTSPNASTSSPSTSTPGETPP